MNFHGLFCARQNCGEMPANAKTLGFAMVVIVGLVAICGTTPVLAQSPSFSDFSSIPNPNLILHGRAAKSGTNVLRLTPASQGAPGSAWFRIAQPVAGGFTTTFTFQISSPGEASIPADGIAFVIQNDPSGTAALDMAGGGSIGYGSSPDANSGTPISHSLAVEFDTFQNTHDPDGNHIAVQSCGSGPNSSDETATYGDGRTPCNLGSTSSLPITLSDGNPHTVRIDYEPPSCGECRGTLHVILLDDPVHPVDLFSDGIPVDLSSLGLGTGGTALVGFTAATGSYVENNDILRWTFTPHGGETISQPAPANVFTIYSFGAYLYAVKPDKDIDRLSVTSVPTDPTSFNPGPFVGAKCTVPDQNGGKCAEFSAKCTDITHPNCNNVSYEVKTSYDVVPDSPPITGPGFLKADNQTCPPPDPSKFHNIITAFSQDRIDPTTKGASKPSFSCFVAVQGVIYPFADVDLVNLAKRTVNSGDNLTYVIPVVNFGPGTAQGVALTDSIPLGTRFVSATLCTFGGGCSPCSLSGGVVGGTATCTAVTMAPFTFQTMLLVVKVTAPAGSTITDTVSSTAFNPDPRPADNSSTAVTQVVSGESR
jgi:uncharacterized repeat protein (TIGR01451 family)